MACTLNLSLSYTSGLLLLASLTIVWCVCPLSWSSVQVLQCFAVADLKCMDQKYQVQLLTCDSISQAKEKVLDAMYRVRRRSCLNLKMFSFVPDYVLFVLVILGSNSPIDKLECPSILCAIRLQRLCDVYCQVSAQYYTATVSR